MPYVMPVRYLSLRVKKTYRDIVVNGSNDEVRKTRELEQYDDKKESLKRRSARVTCYQLTATYPNEHVEEPGLDE